MAISAMTAVPSVHHAYIANRLIFYNEGDFKGLHGWINKQNSFFE